MKKVLIFLLVSVVIVLAGVDRTSKTSVTFQGIGSFSTTDHIMLVADKKATDSRSEFSSDDMIKGMAAKLLLNPGHNGEIIDLSKMQIIKLDHEDQEYSIEEIKKYESEGEAETPATMEESDTEEEQETEEQEETVRIIRNEFKVNATGEKQDIHGFPCSKYTVLWLTEWEDTQDGRRGIDSLISIVWTTPVSATITQAEQEEMAFGKAYLAKIGMDMDMTKNMILGSNWMALLSSMSPGSNSSDKTAPDMAGEMAKIQGYPILVDGKYFAIRPNEEEPEEEEESGGGLFGMIAKKVLKPSKPKPTTLQPALAWYTEIMEIKITEPAPDVFQIPGGYEQK